MTLRVSLLYHVNTNPGQTATEIARYLGARLSTVSSLLNQMFRQGAMNRTLDRPWGGYRYTLTHPFPRRTSGGRIQADPG